MPGTEQLVAVRVVNFFTVDQDLAVIRTRVSELALLPLDSKIAVERLSDLGYDVIRDAEENTEV
jgi:hypothetical protein